MAALRESDWKAMLTKLYEHMGMDQPVATSRAELAEATGLPIRSLQSLLAVTRHLGIVEMKYEQHPSGKGRASIYKIVEPYEQAVTRLATFGYENILRYRSEEAPRVALAPDQDQGELRAVAGEDAESPFAALRPLKYNESQAQIEAARQYRDRMAFVEQQISVFTERGIKVDRRAFRLVRDRRLETLTLVLPYVESLERQVENLGKRSGVSTDDLRRQNNELQAEVQRLSGENRRLQDRVKSLLSETVSLRQRAPAEA